MTKNGKPGRLYLAGLLCVLMQPSLAMGQGGSPWESYKNAGIEAYEQGNNAEAERLFKNSLAEAAKPGQSNSHLITSLQLLGDFYAATARLEEAYKTFELLLEKMTIIGGLDHPVLAIPLRGIARIEQSKKQYPEAERLFRRALVLLEKGSGNSHPDVASICEDLAGLYVIQKRYSEAESLYRRSLAIGEQEFGPDDPRLAASLNNLAGVYSIQDKITEAEPLYKKAVTILERTYGRENANLVAVLANYSSLLRKAGRTAEADELDGRVKAIRAKYAQSNSAR